MSEPLPLLQGTLDVLVLKALEESPKHGYGVARWIRETTDDVLNVEEGALYTSLHRMERKGWIESEWGLSDKNRRAKYYSLKSAGRKQLNSGGRQLARYADAVVKVLGAAALG